jgi:very-short-patch-repair endonuclease
MRYRLDMGWRHWRLGLEYDGEEFHGEEFEAHDKARRAWIRGRGWTVQAFRKEHVFTASHAFEDAVSSLVNEASSRT